MLIEYVVWGHPKGRPIEEALVKNGIKTEKEAKRIEAHFKTFEKYKDWETRIAKVDLTTKPDFAGTIK